MESSSNRHITWLLLVWGLGAGMIACSADEPPRSSSAESSDQMQEVSRGSLLAEFERNAANTDRTFTLHAQFLDAQGVPVETAMQTLEVWSFDSALDRDACSLRRRESPRTQSESENRDRGDRVHLDLLNVGPITVRGPEQTLQLEGRRLPDLSSAFSGVIYGREAFTSEDRASLNYRPGGLYTFEAPGRHSTGPFRVSLRAPTPIELRPDASLERREETLILPRGRDLNVQWSRAPSSDSAVFFDVSTGFGPDDLHLKCRLEDDGSFQLPADVLDQLGDETSSLQIELRRIRTESVRIEGLDLSRFTFATVDRRQLVLEP